MTQYETLFVVHPEKGARIKEFIERFKKIIEGQEGTLAQAEEWGLRDLAYRIQKQGKGYYTLLQYHSSARAVEELERNLKLTDDVLRYLTVRFDEEDQPAGQNALDNRAGEAEREQEVPRAEPQSNETPAEPDNDRVVLWSY